MAFYTSGACEINWYWLDWLGIKSWLFVHNFYYEYYITPYHITNAPSADCFHYNNGNNSTWPYLLRMQTNPIFNISFLSIIWKHLWLIIIGQREFDGLKKIISEQSNGYGLIRNIFTDPDCQISVSSMSKLYSILAFQTPSM